MHMDNVILCQFPATKDIPNFSPFCMKLETYFRMAKIPYHVQDYMNPLKGPKNKLPFAIINGKAVSDSGLIIDYFERTLDNPLDENLNPKQRAEALMIRHTLEEHLYFIIMWSRWMDEAGWEVIKKLFFKKTPAIVRLMSGKIRKQVSKQLYEQGMGRHTKEEIYAMGKQDIDAVAQLMGERSFYFGKQPTSIDACIFAFVGAIWFIHLDNPLIAHLKTKNNLLEYYGRIAHEYFHEFPEKPSY